MNVPPLRVGVAGVGEFARTHAAAIRRCADTILSGFVGRRPADAAAIASEFGVRPFESLESMLEFSDAVVIATPHGQHADLAVRTLRAGRHVLVEKPLALDVADAERVIAAADASSGVAVVGHLMRFAPAHRHARAMIEAGAVGTVLHAVAERVVPWRVDARRPWHLSTGAGGGMWMVQGVHAVDQLSWLLGARAATAIGTRRRAFHSPDRQDADDGGAALLDFGGAVGQIVLAGLPFEHSRVGTTIYGDRGAMWVSHRGALRIDTGAGWTDPEWTSPPDQWMATLDSEWTAFVAAVTATDHDGPGAPGLEYGRYVLTVVDAVTRSVETGCIEQVA